MNKIAQIIRGFLTAEEVPRWFGLSVVLLYIIGLASAGNYGIHQAHRDANQYFAESANYTVRLLAERLSGLPGQALTDPMWIGACQRELREFAAAVRVDSARVMFAGRIVASSRGSESGKLEPILEADDGDLSTPVNMQEAGPALARVRVPLTVTTPVTVAGSDSAAHKPGSAAEHFAERPYLEVALPATVFASPSSFHAATFIIVLVVLGAFFLVYRALRRQLRGVSKIVNRLQSHGKDLQAELSSLRIVDTIDGVTTAWNSLVDLTQRLSDSLELTSANDELSRALQRSSSGALADVLNALPDGVIFIADEGRFEFLNLVGCRLFQWSSQEVKQLTLADAKSTGVGTTLIELMKAALQPDGSFEARCETVEGDNAHADSSSYRVWIVPLQRSKHVGGCVVIVRDASQQIRADRAREEFIAQVTHELRTPLTNIRAYAETLSSGMFEDPKVITECYNVITKETRRLSRLVEDILSVSQLEVGAIDLRIDQVDLRTLLSEGLRDVRGLAEEKSIDIQLVLPSKLEPIKGDRDKLAVVLNNLLGNAIKYTPKSGNVVVGCQIAAESVVITVKDNGIGIAPAEHPKVFEKFQRGSNPEVQKETGTGIGLYTAREIVRRHGGEIELISDLQKGSTFLVRLPLPDSRANALTPVQEGAARG